MSIHVNVHGLVRSLGADVAWTFGVVWSYDMKEWRRVLSDAAASRAEMEVYKAEIKKLQRLEGKCEGE